MSIVDDIVEFGTEAVSQYRTISGQQDNALPEVFLGGYLAPRLYDHFHCPVHIEHNYLLVVSSRGVPITPDVVSKVGYFRADIAMYPNGVPPVIVEFKIFDEGTQVSSILSDADKLKKLSDICPVNGYLGVLVCQTNVSLESRIAKVEEGLNQKLHTGEPQRSADGNWRWSFACAAMEGLAQA